VNIMIFPEQFAYLHVRETW